MSKNSKPLGLKECHTCTTALDEECHIPHHHHSMRRVEYASHSLKAGRASERGETGAVYPVERFEDDASFNILEWRGITAQRIIGHDSDKAVRCKLRAREMNGRTSRTFL